MYLTPPLAHWANITVSNNVPFLPVSIFQASQKIKSLPLITFTILNGLSSSMLKSLLGHFPAQAQKYKKSARKNFLIFPKRNHALFSPILRNKRPHPGKIYYTLGNGSP